MFFIFSLWGGKVHGKQKHIQLFLPLHVLLLCFLFPQLQVLSWTLLPIGGCGKGDSLPKQGAILLCWQLPETLLLPLTGDGMVKAQPAPAGVFRFVFSDILFLAQLHCLRCELAAELLVRRCCLGGEGFCSLTAARLSCC